MSGTPVGARAATTFETTAECDGYTGSRGEIGSTGGENGLME